MTEKHNEALSRPVFEERLTCAYPMVFNRLVARFKDAQLAEEVSVDSLAHAFEKWHADPRFSARMIWWAGAAGGPSARAGPTARCTRHRPLPNEHPLETGEIVSVPSVLTRYEDPLASRMRDREIAWSCIQKLDPEDRAILSRYYYEGRTDQELGAELFGNSASSQANGLKVWRRRQRACERLRVLLMAHGIEPADWSTAGAQAV